MQSIQNITENLLWKLGFFVQDDPVAINTDTYGYNGVVTESIFTEFSKITLELSLAFFASFFAMLLSASICKRYLFARFIIFIIFVSIFLFFVVSINLQIFDKPSLFEDPRGLFVLLDLITIVGFCLGLFLGNHYQSSYIIKRKRKRT